MLTNKFNSDLIAAASRVISGQTTERKALPQSLKDAAVAAVKKMRVLSEGVQSAESRRDTLRAFFVEGVKGCGCTPTMELVKDFQTEVEDLLKGKIKTEEAVEENEIAEAVPSTGNPYKDAKKYFNRVQVDIFDLGKISKEIENALKSGADLDKVMPELVKKYRKN
jgi:hypothetical protein